MPVYLLAEAGFGATPAEPRSGHDRLERAVSGCSPRWSVACRPANSGPSTRSDVEERHGRASEFHRNRRNRSQGPALRHTSGECRITFGARGGWPSGSTRRRCGSIGFMLPWLGRGAEAFEQLSRTSAKIAPKLKVIGERFQNKYRHSDPSDSRMSRYRSGRLPGRTRWLPDRYEIAAARRRRLGGREDPRPRIIVGRQLSHKNHGRRGHVQERWCSTTLLEPLRGSSC
jgi:hypothetical protein